MRAVIPYTTDAQANAATKNPQLKLMFRLVHCHVRDEGKLRVFVPSLLLLRVFFSFLFNGRAKTVYFLLNFFPPTRASLPSRGETAFPVRPLQQPTDRTVSLAHNQCPDADELEWYIPAGIDLPDLRRALAVIEQFEKSPLDLGGKRASQLLRKKKRRNRRRVQRRPRHTSADSDDDNDDGSSINNNDSSSGDEGEGSGEPSNKTRKTAARAREREAYKSAQFIEDSDEEYGRDIDSFFVREAELRERTALAAVDSALGTGTMRATGTKKRRRPRGRPTTAVAAEDDDDVGDPDPEDADGDGGGGGARQTKRRAVREHGAQSESESASDGGGAEEEPPAPRDRDRRPPKPRPRYRGSASATTTTAIGEPSPTEQPQTEGQIAAFAAPGDAEVSSHDVGDQGRNVSDAEDGNGVEDDESKNHRVSLAHGGGGAEASSGSGPRKGRVIISDEDE